VAERCLRPGLKLDLPRAEAVLGAILEAGDPATIYGNRCGNCAGRRIAATCGNCARTVLNSPLADLEARPRLRGQ